jgi:flagellar basal-body rod protein FlgG
MLEILQISENGLRSNQEWLNNISHNIANIQTPGFRKTSLNFGELVSSPTPSNQMGKKEEFRGMGVAVESSMLDSKTGNIKSTGRSLDVAVTGNGFLEIELENGESAYTRAGRLSVNADGRLVTQGGLLLSSDISVPSGAKNILINETGVVTAQMNAGETIELGQLTLVKFTAPEFLHAIGSEHYTATEKSGQSEKIVDKSEGGFMQGYLEMSNVDLIDEMGDLMMAQRAYQLNARLIQTADQILETINNLRR